MLLITRQIICRREIHVRVRDENEFPPEWALDQYNVEVIVSIIHFQNDKYVEKNIQKIQKVKQKRRSLLQSGPIMITALG